MAEELEERLDDEDNEGQVLFLSFGFVVMFFCKFTFA